MRSTGNGELQGLEELIAAGHFDRAWSSLHDQAGRATDAVALLALARLRRRLRTASAPPALTVQARVALLGGATTSMLEEPLRLLLATLGVECSLFASPYNTVARQMLDPASETVASRPDIAVVVVTPANITMWPEVPASAAEVQRTIEGGVRPLDRALPFAA